jgi:hypothetical protein
MAAGLKYAPWVGEHLVDGQAQFEHARKPFCGG